MPTQPSKSLETVPNPHPDREYEVEMTCPELTCVCSMTGQPDFATYRITYAPGPRLVELKSLKLYLWSYRDEGAFHEDGTNRILNDLVETCAPRRMTVVGELLENLGKSSPLTECMVISLTDGSLSRILPASLPQI